MNTSGTAVLVLWERGIPIGTLFCVFVCVLACVRVCIKIDMTYCQIEHGVHCEGSMAGKKGLPEREHQ